MSLKARIYLTALAFFAASLLSMNPYPYEFILAAITLSAIGILIKNKKESQHDS